MIEVAFLGQAMWEICQAQLLDYGRDEQGFWAEFNKSIDNELFSVVGERVSTLLNKEYRIIEMTLVSLKGLLRHHGQYTMARGIEEEKLYTVYQSDGYAAIVDDTSVNAILLTGFKGTTIRGIGGDSKGEVKEKAKRIREGIKKDHRGCKELFDWIESRLVWFPEGVQRREEVKEIVRGAYSELGMVEVMGDPLETIVSRVGKNVWGWKEAAGQRGIMEESEGSFFYAKFENEKEVHSYLQSLVKISKMLGLNTVCLLNREEVTPQSAIRQGDIIELIATDGYGQEQRVSRIEVGDGVLKGSLVESIERVIALQIENG